jgi:1-acyl-sn-glycerol-3-phosphate acyltransferase
MSAGLNYCWRLAATGFCFFIFSAGGLLLTLFVFPALLLTPRRDRAQHARRAIRQSFRLFLWIMEGLGIMRLELIGGEKLGQCSGTLVLANHPTLIDVVALLSVLPTASCVVKQALLRNPFLGGVLRTANYISNAEGESLVDECVRHLADGNPLVIFPEGTRSQPGKPIRFLRGASFIALKSGVPILPVLIDCNPPTLTKREKWYQIPPRRFHLRIEVLDALDARRWVASNEASPLVARRLTRELEDFFSKELSRYGCTDHAQA